MLRKLLILLLISLTLASCKGHQPSNDTFTDISGKQIRFSQLHGKWVFINYWATWCHSCKAEIPELNAFYKSHKAKALVLGVNFDHLPTNELKKAAHQFSIAFPVLTQNPQKALNLPDIDVVPTTFVLNPQGKLVSRLIGPQTRHSLAKLLRQ